MNHLSSCRFRRAFRLLKTDEYSSVFSLRLTRSNQYFQVYVCPNQLGYARLGLIVGKRVAKRAHHRHYIKRMVREWFRQHHDQLGSIDYVVRAKRDVERDQRLPAITALTELFAKLGRCHASLLS